MLKCRHPHSLAQSSYVMSLEVQGYHRSYTGTSEAYTGTPEVNLNGGRGGGEKLIKRPFQPLQLTGPLVNLITLWITRFEVFF
jgi:hypothetical protein